MGHYRLSYAGTDAAIAPGPSQSLYGNQTRPPGSREGFATPEWRLRPDQAGMAEAIDRFPGPLCDRQRSALPAGFGAAALAGRSAAVQPTPCGPAAENWDRKHGQNLSAEVKATLKEQRARTT